MALPAFFFNRLWNVLSPTIVNNAARVFSDTVRTSVFGKPSRTSGEKKRPTDSQTFHLLSLPFLFTFGGHARGWPQGLWIHASLLEEERKADLPDSADETDFARSRQRASEVRRWVTMNLGVGCMRWWVGEEQGLYLVRASTDEAPPGNYLLCVTHSLVSHPASSSFFSPLS